MSERTDGCGSAHLSELRAEIDRIDEGLLELMALRRDLALRIGEVKRQHGIGIVDPGREAAVVRRSAQLARSRDLDSERVRTVFWQLIAISRSALSRAEAAVAPPESNP